MKYFRNFLSCIALFAGMSASAADAKWINSTANTPDTAYNWSDATNWKDGYVGGAGDTVDLSPSAKVYIKVPDDGVTVYILKGSANAVVIGEGAITIASGFNAKGNKADGQIASTSPIYCPVVFSDDNVSTPYLAQAVFCGRVYNRWNPSKYIVGSSGAVDFRFDKYAESAGEVRSGDLSDISGFGVGSTPLSFYPPHGADATNGVWKLAAGSAYATRISAAAHPLAAGTLVSAEGFLPEGTFLKRIFDDGTIELSAAALQDAQSGAALQFAAFNPDFTAAFPARFTLHGSFFSCNAVKARAEDKARIEIGDYYFKTESGRQQFGSLYAKEFPATIVLSKLSGTTKFPYFELRNVHLELAGDPSTGVTEFLAAQPWTMHPTGYKATVTVPAAKTGIVNTFTNMTGTLVKDGAGVLKIGLSENTHKGTVDIAEGTLEFMRGALFAEEELKLDLLTVRAGATLVLPECGLTVRRLEAEPGAVIGGSGILSVLESDNLDDLSKFVFTSGAKIDFARGEDASEVSLEVPEAKVFGRPAFWVDASKLDSIVTNDAGGVLRWNDCREGETMFCTNVASVYPKLVHGERFDKKYVHLARNHNATKIEETPQLVWSEPISDIRAVFLVTDPVDGGGEILGCTSARLPWGQYYGSQGGPYYRGAGAYANPLIEDSYCTPCVRYGRFFIDGVEVDGGTTGFKGGFLQLVEHHVNTNLMARPTYGRRELVCDAFGTGYVQPHNDLKYKFGMRIAECIVYTNSLTRAQRLQTAQYLMRKWFKRDVYRSVADTNNVIKVSGAAAVIAVGEDKSLAVSRVESAKVAKTGAGLLYVDGCENAEIDVREGAMVLASGGRATEVPSDAWLHMDADDASTIDKIEGSDSLAVWRDVNGSGRTLRSIRGSVANKTKVEKGAINNRTAIDLGAYARRSSNVSDGLVVYREDGTLPSSDVNGGISTTYSPPILQTMFFVYDSSAGGGPLFGGVGADWPGKGFPHHFTDENDVPIFYASSYFENVNYSIGTFSNELTKGAAVFRRNGVGIHPFHEKFLKGVERVTIKYNTGNHHGRRGDTFGAYGNTYNTGDYCGGHKYGEIILYPRMLSDEETARVEAYLARKWSGIETPGYGAAETESLAVAAGATLSIVGDPVETARLSGGGTVDGSVKLTDGGVLAVDSADGGNSVSALEVGGTVDFADAGAVELSGDAVKLQVGKYLLVAADEVVPPASGWTVTGGRKHYFYSISATDGAVYLKVAKSGFTLIVK